MKTFNLVLSYLFAFVLGVYAATEKVVEAPNLLTVILLFAYFAMLAPKINKEK